MWQCGKQAASEPLYPHVIDGLGNARYAWQRPKKSCAQRRRKLPYFESHDGTSLFYRRWGVGAPIIFLHAWALNSDVWQPHMIELSERGFSCIALDRRAHGRSDDPGCGFDFDSLSDDVSALLRHLSLTGVTLVGHSIGSAECIRCLTRHGSARVARLVLIAPSLPFMLKTTDNPDGPNEKRVLEGWREIWKTNYADWLAQALPSGFDPDVTPDRIQRTLRLMLQCTVQAAIGTNVALAETDFRSELPRVGVPTLILHGDQDVSCPVEATGRRVAKLISGSQLKIYEGARHGIIATHAKEVSNDIADFIGA
jgi:non-heme chloroperoxidase